MNRYIKTVLIHISEFIYDKLDEINCRNKHIAGLANRMIWFDSSSYFYRQSTINNLSNWVTYKYNWGDEWEIFPS